MASFYIIYDNESGQFLSDVKLQEWEGWFDVINDVYVDCFRCSSKETALAEAKKAAKELHLQFPEDPLESFKLTIFKVKEVKITKTVHESEEIVYADLD